MHNSLYHGHVCKLWVWVCCNDYDDLSEKVKFGLDLSFDMTSSYRFCPKCSAVQVKTVNCDNDNITRIVKE